MKRSVLLIVILAATALLPAGAVGIPALPIPSLPGPGSAPVFEGAAATAQPVPSFAIPQHPFMAPNGRSNIHNDAYMTDAYAGPGPLGRTVGVNSTWLGLEECASITFDSRDRIVALCGSLDGAKLRMMDPTTLATLAIFPLPPRQVRPGTTPFNDFCAAGYFYLDHRDRGVVSTNTNQIWVLSPLPPLFKLERIYNLFGHVPLTDCLVSVLPDWSGRLWFLSKGGVVGTIDPASGKTRSMRFAGETVANSFAVDETGGVFIVTTHALYRLDADTAGGPAITWRAAYDRGSRLKPGQLSQGSGTTPTLVGDDLVAITDNADPRMNVLVFDRGSGALHCSVEAFDPAVVPDGQSATDNSLIAMGNALIVENNYGYTGVTATAQGASTTPGVSRVDIDPVGCHEVWTSAEVSPTTVPKGSLATGLVYVYAKPPRADRVDAWYFTAIDFRTGATAYRRMTGSGYLYNNHYAPITLGPDGSAYIGSLGGFIRIADR